MGEFVIEKYNRIKLDGTVRKGEDLKFFCETRLNLEGVPQWRIDIYQFILDWLSLDDFIVAYTSGSTGAPKQIKLLKKHMVASASKTVDYFNISKDQTALLCLSANYIAGKMMLVRAFVGGFNLLLTKPSTNPLESVLVKIDFIAMVPLQVAQLLPEIMEGEKVKSVIIGGGAIPDELRQHLLNAKTNCYETYGMTETVSHVAIRKVGNDAFKAMSKVLFGKDHRGCLTIKASDILQQAIITNDIVELLSETEFKWLGRYDNIINSGGIKLIPEKIEEKLAEYIAIPFYISSIPDVILGEKVVLVIENGSDVESVKCMLSQVQGVSKYEIPKSVLVVTAFPFTESNKIKRIELKRLVASLVR